MTRARVHVRLDGDVMEALREVAGKLGVETEAAALRSIATLLAREPAALAALAGATQAPPWRHHGATPPAGDDSGGATQAQPWRHHGATPTEEGDLPSAGDLRLEEEEEEEDHSSRENAVPNESAVHEAKRLTGRTLEPDLAADLVSFLEQRQRLAKANPRKHEQIRSPKAYAFAILDDWERNPSAREEVHKARLEQEAEFERTQAAAHKRLEQRRVADRGRRDQLIRLNAMAAEDRAVEASAAGLAPAIVAKVREGNPVALATLAEALGSQIGGGGSGQQAREGPSEAHQRELGPKPDPALASAIDRAASGFSRGRRKKRKRGGR